MVEDIKKALQEQISVQIDMENKAVAFADKLTASFKKLWKVAEPTRKAIKKLWDEGLAKLAKFTWTALKDFYGEFLVPVGKWALGKGIPELVNATNDFLNKIIRHH